MRVIAAASAITFMLSATASAWRINAKSGIWMGEGTHSCTAAKIKAGETVYISQLSLNERVYFFKDGDCKEFEDLVIPPGRTVVPDTELGSFKVVELLPN